MNLIVLTPEKEIFNGKVTSVQVPGISGKFEILNNHAPIVSALSKGRVRLVLEGGDKKTFEIRKGFIEVLKNEVSLLVQGVSEES
jgi:F-type H+-transporting ATPase subunit epsilon